MTEDPDQMGPEEAAQNIRDVHRKMNAYRRRYLLGAVILGVLTLGFFALVGIVPRATIQPYLPLFIIVPAAFVPIMLRFRRASGNSAAVLALEQRLATAYTVTLLLAIAVDVFVLRQGTWQAMLPGILPAGVCFVGAALLARRL